MYGSLTPDVGKFNTFLNRKEKNYNYMQFAER